MRLFEVHMFIIGRYRVPIFTIERKTAIKFNFKLNKNATQTFKIMKTMYGDVCLSRSQVFEWCSQFKNGRESSKDDLKGPNKAPIMTRMWNSCTLLLSHNRKSLYILYKSKKEASRPFYMKFLVKKKVYVKFVPEFVPYERLISAA